MNRAGTIGQLSEWGMSDRSNLRINNMMQILSLTYANVDVDIDGSQISSSRIQGFNQQLIIGHCLVVQRRSNANNT